MGDQLEDLLEGFEHTLRRSGGESIRSFEFERSNPADSDGFLSYRATVSSCSGDDVGGSIHVVCIHDVTEERRQEFAQLSYLHRLSHKIRTPLTLLSSANTLLVDSMRRAGGRDDEAERLADSSLRELMSIVDRFTGLVSFREIGERGRVPVALSSLVEGALSLARPEIDAAGLSVKNEIEPNSVELIVAAERLCECFLETIHNACKFAGPQASLTIRASVGDGLAVSFSDDGPGIASSELDRVLGLFQQVDEDDTGETPGFGVGLWWIREVARLHGGDVSVECGQCDGRGTTVEFTLPASVCVTSPAPGDDDSNHVDSLTEETPLPVPTE